jgi:hypothetical protein
MKQVARLLYEVAIASGTPTDSKEDVARMAKNLQLLGGVLGSMQVQLVINMLDDNPKERPRAIEVCNLLRQFEKLEPAFVTASSQLSAKDAAQAFSNFIVGELQTRCFQVVTGRKSSVLLELVFFDAPAAAFDRRSAYSLYRELSVVLSNAELVRSRLPLLSGVQYQLPRFASDDYHCSTPRGLRLNGQ